MWGLEFTVLWKGGIWTRTNLNRYSVNNYACALQEKGKSPHATYNIGEETYMDKYKFQQVSVNHVCAHYERETLTTLCSLPSLGCYVCL